MVAADTFEMFVSTYVTDYIVEDHNLNIKRSENLKFHIWDLWGTKWRWNRLVSQYLQFHCQYYSISACHRYS
jgi:hypothetical protein